MGNRTPSGPNLAAGDDDPALAHTQAAVDPIDGVSAVDSPSPSDADPFVGTVLEGKYKMMELVGSGGMGRVYKAEQLSTGRFVAVKVLHERFGSTPAQAVRERFLAEVRMTAALNHPSIVTIHDAGETAQGVPYLVMEFLLGEDLATVLDRGEQFAPPRVVEIMRQVCDALHAAHERGVVHRDLKPENIFLVRGSGNTELVKVVDFGIAKANAEILGDARLTAAGQVLGTPDYMAPEQARGGVVDRRMDIYAAGLIAYEMLTGGHLPHAEACGRDSSPLRVIHIKADNTPPKPVTDYRPDLKPALARAVMHAIENDPMRRTPTMAQFAQELRAAMAAPSRGTTTAKAAAQLQRKSFPTFGFGVAAAAALAVVVGVVIARSGDEPETATVPAVAQPVQPATTMQPVEVQTAQSTPPPVVVAPVPVAPTPSVIVITPQPVPTPTPAAPTVTTAPQAPAAPPPAPIKVVKPVPAHQRAAPTASPEPARAQAHPTPPAERPAMPERRDDGRAVRATKIAELRKVAQDLRSLLRRNPRSALNTERRERLAVACRELRELGDTVPECQ